MNLENIVHKKSKSKNTIFEIFNLGKKHKAQNHHSKNHTKIDSLLLSDLQKDLEKPANMSPELEQFLKMIYSNKECMKESRNALDNLYDKYTRMPKNIPPCSWNNTRLYLIKLKNSISEDMINRAQFQETGQRLKYTLDNINLQYQNYIPIAYNFLCFVIKKDKFSYRAYANIKKSHVGVAINIIDKYIKDNKDHGIVAFKVAGPGISNHRSDSLVIYCQNKQSASKIATHLSATMNNSLNKEVPHMLKPIGNGTAIGSEPNLVEIGIRPLLSDCQINRHSFGTLRTELIYSAILHYLENKKYYPQNFETFKRFVAASFRGNGIDPLNPAD